MPRCRAHACNATRALAMLTSCTTVAGTNKLQAQRLLSLQHCEMLLHRHDGVCITRLCQHSCCETSCQTKPTNATSTKPAATACAAVLHEDAAGFQDPTADIPCSTRHRDGTITHAGPTGPIAVCGCQTLKHLRGTRGLVEGPLVLAAHLLLLLGGEVVLWDTANKAHNQQRQHSRKMPNDMA